MSLRCSCKQASIGLRIVGLGNVNLNTSLDEKDLKNTLVCVENGKPEEQSSHC